MKDIPEDLLELINKRISEGWRFSKYPTSDGTYLIPPEGDKRKNMGGEWTTYKIIIPSFIGRE